MTCALVALLFMGASGYAWAQEEDPPPPPPLPGDDTMVGDTVTNPVTGESTVVLELILDPEGTTDPRELAWVRTDDGYTILVKRDVNDIFFGGGDPPTTFVVVASNPGAMPPAVDYRPCPGDPPDCDDDTVEIEPLAFALTNDEYDENIDPQPEPPEPPTFDPGSGDSTGKFYGGTGPGGRNGNTGALFVPAGDGRNGGRGPDVVGAGARNTDDIVATTKFGIEVRSVGGKGGNGGNSIFSFWSPGDGGSGGKGGTIDFVNDGSVATSGNGNHGIFAYSRSGAAGRAGDGILAIGSGEGGASPDGGDVTVTNNGDIFTRGNGAHGIYVLSQSNNGGSGGASWGVVSSGGRGGPAGDGGEVEVTNNARIETEGVGSHGIFAQSVGGTGGSAGPAGGLIGLGGEGGTGGNGDKVTVTNNGTIITNKADSKGIMAQSVGGGGGTGGASGGLAALGGAGAGGGSSGLVTVTNNASGSITTFGNRSDGIFAQSVGGSGGSGGGSGGLVAIGGGGSVAGSGGEVEVENFGSITTSGNGARGIIAQSIGGGGGDGGSSGGLVAVGGTGDGGGDSSTVTVVNAGNIVTGADEDGADDAIGLFAQSVGGGGGNGGSAGSISAFIGVAVGGNGAGGGDGGRVDVTLQGQESGAASQISTNGDRSTGIFAQSVGGGGGNGGGAVQVTAGYIGAVSIAVGGKGAGGGEGKEVTLSNGNDGVNVVTTRGDDSTGVFLQSVGGGGGNGGYAVSIAACGSDNVCGSLSVGVGGNAGGGGKGGTVTVGEFDDDGNFESAGFSGTILTTGERSTGFMAQSVGGGGGNGGLAVSVPIAASGGFSASLGVGVGGEGGIGGDGGDVSVGYEGDVTTEGTNSTGMIIQSVGGGGGNGGGSISASLSGSGGGAVSAGVSVGGDAGDGSIGGTVRAVTRDSTVITRGAKSTGIIVQSVGGGGGNGGYAISAGIAGAGSGAGSINVGLGGKGGTGGDSGQVFADLQSEVSTFEDDSTGIIVQSIGGGGGNGGFTVSGGIAAAGSGAGSVAVGLGGTGGAGGDGESVNASSTGAITTRGNNSGGLIVQSIGGGGGNGGFNISGSLAGSGSAAGAVSVGLGGNGGTGGIARSVTASSSGDVLTQGNDSTGILAQSVGGGGGNGGFNVNVSFAGSGSGSAAIGVGLGGSGGAGSDASTVDLTIDNDVTTLGDDSVGVIAQSIGGGGGNGGFNVTVTGAGSGSGAGAVGVGLGGSGAGGGDAKRVTHTMTGNIETQGDDSTGLLVQSVGGGGGNGGFNVTATIIASGSGAAGASVGLGGSGGTGGTSGEVESSLTGNVTTVGEQSTGVVAQSLGGGGGNGGVNVSGTLTMSGSGSGGAAIGLGGAGGGGGDVLGTVTNTVTGNVTTFGESSGGVLAQSLGGGGGNGGLNISGAITASGSGGGAAAVGIGGSGGGGGDSSTVTNTVTGNVTTVGDDAAGVVAQTLGGGGGNGGLNVSAAVTLTSSAGGSASVGLGGSGGDGGNALGAVTNTVTGDVMTFGESSGGVLAQSVGGGGGNGGLNVSAALTATASGGGAAAVGLGGSGGGGGNSSAVTSTVTGDVTTVGTDSAGVVAQSLGGGGGNGGINVSGAVTLTSSGSFGAAVGLGGSGGDGGDALGEVTNTVIGDVMTFGESSGGVLAQSLGGGGGNGGLNVSGAISASNSGTGAAAFGMGGSGGDGGDSSAVTNTVTGDVTTVGADASGVVAQSLGGGGGNGGLNVTGTLAVSTSSGTFGAAVGLGGSGGGGGDVLGEVTNTVTGDVTTLGESSGGVLAQSLGGGGGNGGLNVSAAVNMSSSGSGAIGFGMGGSGGDGGDSSAVTNTVTGDVSTSGEEAFGVVAQSLGGGGGNGGLNVSGAVTITKSAGGAVGVGIGGSGGDGGNSADVANTVTGDVSTLGDDAYGVLAQSVGGGGGNGAINVSAGVSITKSGAGAVGVGFGGTGGGGGTAGDVESTVTGLVTTEGLRSGGVVTQSIGGGGGNGGLNVAVTLTGSKSTSGGLAVGVGGFGGAGKEGGDATSTVTGGVSTLGDDSSAILTQSLGGGGGNGGINVTAAVNLTKEKGGALGVGVGGFGADGGDAGEVISTVTATEGNLFRTAGDNSSAIVAQSVGGGGGNGGVNVTSAVSITGKSGAAIGVGVGGFGAGAGDGGDVTLTATGDVFTAGNDSHGVFAQSLGGGGGNGGVNVTAGLNVNKEGQGGTASIGVGGFGGDGGSSGDVNVTYQGRIQARPTDPQGPGSHGLVAQSLAGGGGNGGVNVSAGLAFSSRGENGDGQALAIGVGGFGGAGGDAGAVDVTVGGGSFIASAGDDRSALLAQSIGGSGGNGGVNVSGGIAADAPIVFGMGGFGGGAGKAETVTVNAQSNLVAVGRNARGIFAQSVGGGGGNGGLNVSGAISYDKGTFPPAITFGMGGFGGDGNVSSDVDVTHEGIIATGGESGHGIFAQSIAGGGGNGGMNVSTSLIVSEEEDSGGFKDLSITAGVGGHGGTGADAGDTSVASVGNITTRGDFARGIFAQSVGGGGGNGGMNFTGNVAQKSSLVTVGVGGFGAGGGNAGDVSVTRGDEDTVAGKISTDGMGAIGIESSSIGGGGGDAGLNLVASVSFAGDDDDDNGGNGDDNGDTKPRPRPKHDGIDPEVFDNYDKVLDELEGRQKKDKEDDKQKKDSSSFAAQFAIGGSGGGAGDGGDAAVDNHGDVQTVGQQSHGILAQSIGGGGGNAAANIAITYFRGDAVNRGLNFALGGAGGDGGAAGDVQVDHDGNLETRGADSYGIIAQSVGGGGGNASAFLNKAKGDVSKLDISIGRLGGTGGEGGDVSLSSAGTVITRGDRSWGLIAQSIGNGGGNSSATTISGTVEGKKGQAARGASLSIGLEGAMGGSAGDVTVAVEGLVGTEGNDAHAIFAQSVGGGGGNGGDASGSSANASISLGGTGGMGGTGGEVRVDTAADVRTIGSRAYGLIAQSIGGGGGNGGKSDAEVESSEPGLAVSLGGIGGEGSTGGDVTVANSGVIITGGEESIGVLAQSIGGGGGTGGMTVTTLKTKEEEPEDEENGGGGSGGSGGGSSGDDDSGGSGTVQVGVGIGGAGGDGANAGTVQVVNTGGIGTAGTTAPGIFAQSIGGGGGNASQVVSKFSGAGLKISTGLGGIRDADGMGGMGGTGGDVLVENLADADGNAAQIITEGVNSHGIVAMSIGGGGGNGSTMISQDANESDDEGTDETGEEDTSRSVSVSTNIGGQGGQGGTSGLVTVVNAGEIVTRGEGAHGIFAQSIGGGGGNGGVAYSQGSDSSKFGSAFNTAVSIGGEGGSGNVSGNVVVTNTGSIDVSGDAAYGIFAQSIGGGGGNGGAAGEAPEEDDGNIFDALADIQSPSTFGVNVGGAGGDGADSGDVFVDHRGSIVSRGDDSYGIFAQAIGGGGGTAGISYSAPIGRAPELTLPLRVGSNDGGTGEAGRVVLNTEGDILMLGENSQPYLAQSVNGGGGNVRVTLDTSRTTLGQVDPGPGKPEDPVSAFIVALVEVGSDLVENGLGADMESEHVGTLLSLGKSSPASSTQSVGGGGGNANVDLTVNAGAVIDLEFLLGGSNSTNSSGGDIDFGHTGDAATVGDSSKAISVQSIGGGGGDVTVGVTTVDGPAPTTLAKAPSTSFVKQATSSDGKPDRRWSPAGPAKHGRTTIAGTTAKQRVAADETPKRRWAPGGPTKQRSAFQATDEEATAKTRLALGADGSTGNDGGSVGAAIKGDITTEGNLSPGLVVQSIGAGGGDVRVGGNDEVAVGLGGKGGATGDGGDIDLAYIGDLTTLGTLSPGVVLQSIGGGGGTVLTDTDEASITVELNSENSGSGGDVQYSQTGDVQVDGDRSTALIVQSLGGGGGLADRVFQGSAGGDGDSGSITVDLDGSLVSTGNRGVGAFLQSAAQGAQGDLDLTLNEGHMIQGGTAGVAVSFSGGRDNRFTNRGTVMTADGIEGLAVLADGGTNEVDNSGQMLGNVDLGQGNNRYLNRENAVFAAGSTVQLGDDGLLVNEGSFAPGDNGLAQTTTLTGSFRQGAAGTTFSELDFLTDGNDRITGSGEADLDGTVDVSLLNVPFIPVGSFSRTLVSAGGGVTDSGISLDTAASVVIEYGLAFTPRTLDLEYEIDFSPEGIGDTIRAVGNYINRGQIAGGGTVEYGELIEKLVFDPDIATYKDSLSQLSPEFHAEHQVDMLNDSIEFGRRLMSCKQAGGGHRFTAEGTCLWLIYENEEGSVDSYDDRRDIDQSSHRVLLGGQKTLENDWTFGAGLSRSTTDSDGFANRWDSDMLAYQVGVSAKRRRGATKFSSVLTYGWSEADTERRGELLEPYETDVSRDMSVWSLGLRAQHDYEFSKWFVRPMVDVGGAYLRTQSANEDGLGPADLEFDSRDEGHAWVRPGVEVGSEWEIQRRSLLRLNLGFAAQQYVTGDSTKTRTRFAGAPGDIEPLTVKADLGEPQYSGRIGVDFLTRRGIVLRFDYQRDWSDHRDTDTLRFKVEHPL